MIKKILNIGSITKDLIITPTNKYNQIGGAVYYQLSTLNQLKIPNTSIIMIGEDDHEMLDEVNTENIKVIRTKKTMKYSNIYDKDNNRTQKAYFPMEEITIQQLDEININLKEYDKVILSPLSKYEIKSETLKYFKKYGLETTLLIQGYTRDLDKEHNIIKRSWKDYADYLEYSDVICCDDEEIKTALGKNTINDEDLFKLQEKYNLKEIIITKSTKGSTIYSNNKRIDIPCIRTDKVVDPTGLGDTYISAYTYKRRKSDCYTAGLFASITAKNKIETKGTIKCKKEEIEEELEKILNQR